MLDIKEIRRFQEIFYREFGYELSPTESAEYAEQLIELIRAVYEKTD